MKIKISSAVVLEAEAGASIYDFLVEAKELYSKHVYPFTYDDVPVIAMFNGIPLVLDSAYSAADQASEYLQRAQIAQEAQGVELD